MIFNATVIACALSGLMSGSAIAASWVHGERPSFAIADSSVVMSRSYAQNNNVRSKSEVVRQVKQEYNAEVLKITLNSDGTAYKVRILMPDGRVRQITVSAAS